MEPKRGKGNKEGKICTHSVLTFNLSCHKHNWKLYWIFLPLKARHGFADQPEMKPKDSEGYILLRKSPCLGYSFTFLVYLSYIPFAVSPVSCS